jgi:hypothetical protein
MYLDELAASIRRHIPQQHVPDGDTDELFRAYAVLLQAKGTCVTQSDVHDAWAAWMAGRDGKHEALVPYSELPEDVRDQDRIFTAAIRAAAGEAGRSEGSRPEFSEVLFPSGPPENDFDAQRVFDLYRIMVDSSEALVSRRQGVNTFFLTMNGALLTASGLIVQGAGEARLAALGIFVLGVAGALLCGAWRSLILSFGQLNRGKFQVINAMERHLSAAVYAAEWEALGRGDDPRIYRSFTSREIWVPNSLLGLQSLTALIALSVALGWISIG